MQNKQKIFVSERRFRICDYLLSHSQLLLRSPRTEENPFNIDLIFEDVNFMNLPITLHGLEVINEGKSSEDEIYNIYSLNSGGNLFQIQAGFVLICENELELQETSLGVLEFNGRDKIICTL